MKVKTKIKTKWFHILLIDDIHQIFEKQKCLKDQNILKLYYYHPPGGGFFRFRFSIKLIIFRPIKGFNYGGD